MTRFLLAVAVAAVVTVFNFMIPRAEAAQGSPLATEEPAPPAVERCTTPEMVEQMSDDILAEIGNPPQLTGYRMVGDRFEVAYWAFGEPAAILFTFVDGCLVGSSLIPPPM